MAEIIVYRGAVRDDGFPVLEKIRWIETHEHDPDGQLLPASLGMGERWWRFAAGSDVLSTLPVVPAVTDAFGTVLDPGGLDFSEVDPYSLPLRHRLTLVDYDTYRIGYEDYRQRVDPVGIPALPDGAVPLYVNP